MCDSMCDVCSVVEREESLVVAQDAVLIAIRAIAQLVSIAHHIVCVMCNMVNVVSQSEARTP